VAAGLFYVWVLAFRKSLVSDLRVAAAEIFENEQVIKNRWKEL
jgi:hypothetical protein